MEAEMRNPIHGIIADASVATAFILTVAVAAPSGCVREVAIQGCRSRERHKVKVIGLVG
jgi:hypothetical protein